MKVRLPTWSRQCQGRADSAVYVGIVAMPPRGPARVAARTVDHSPGFTPSIGACVAARRASTLSRWAI